MLTAPMLLLFLAANPENPEYLVLPPPSEFGQAPRMPSMIDGLPGAYDTEDGAVCFPQPLFGALEQWLVYADRYPAKICQRVIDQSIVACRLWAESEQAKQGALHRQQIAKLELREGSTWAWWEVSLMAAGAVVLGAAGGFLGSHYLAP